jgi:hypothetical protein
MSSYADMIIQDTGCDPCDVAAIETIMRDFVFHSTLDWQSRSEFRVGALEAFAMLEADRPIFEEHFRSVRKCFEEMKQVRQA